MKVFILETITQATANSIIGQLDSAEPTEPIEVVIFSDGGSVVAGNAIIHALKAHSGKVTTNVIGMAASMAAIISQVGDNRLISPDAVFNVHNSEIPVMGRGTKESHAEAIKTLKVLDNMLLTSLSKSHLTDTGIKSLMKEDRIMSADEAVSLGFFDGFSAPVQAVAQLNKQLNMNRLQTILAKLDISAVKLGLVKAQLSPEEEAELAVLESKEVLSEEEEERIAMLREKQSAEPMTIVTAELTEDEAARVAELEAKETLTPEEEAELAALMEKKASEPAAAAPEVEPTGAALLTQDMVSRKEFNEFRAELQMLLGLNVTALKEMPSETEMVNLIEAKTTQKLDNVLSAMRSKTVIPTAQQHFAQPKEEPKGFDKSFLDARNEEIKKKNKLN